LASRRILEDASAILQFLDKNGGDEEHEVLGNAAQPSALVGPVLEIAVSKGFLSDNRKIGKGENFFEYGKPNRSDARRIYVNQKHVTEEFD
jgi:hypothetical protein